MTEQQDMLDAGGNVAGASYQGDNVKHLANFFSVFCAPQTTDHREVILSSLKCWEQKYSKLLFAS